MKFKVCKDSRYDYIWDVQFKFLRLFWYTSSTYVTATSMERAVRKVKYLLSEPEPSVEYDTKEGDR